MATHDVNIVKAMADVVYVLVGGGEIVAHGTPEQIFRDPAVLRSSNIEPPVLAELFERLEALGIPLGRPLSVEEAAKAVVEWSHRHGRFPRSATAAPDPSAATTQKSPAPSAGPRAPGAPELPLKLEVDETPARRPAVTPGARPTTGKAP